MSVVVSFRLSQEENEILRRIAAQTGHTIGETVRAMLRDPKIRGLVAGAQERARRDWLGRVYLLCKVCRKPWKLDFYNRPDEAAVLARAFADWGHGECVNPQQ
jgi:hypothetical protein